jgi:hypothetical protein
MLSFGALKKKQLKVKKKWYNELRVISDIRTNRV